jgi:hypothetical protein
MCLHVAHNDVGAPALAAMPLVQHGIRFAYPGSRTQIDTEPTTLVLVATGCRCSLLRPGGRHTQVAVTQAITLEELLWVRAALFMAMFVRLLLRHSAPI